LPQEFQVAFFDEERGTIGIVWDGMENPMAVELPIDGAGYYPSKQDLIQYIAGFVPRNTINRPRQKALEKGIPNVDVVRDLVDPDLMVMDYVATPKELEDIIDEQQRDDFRNGVLEVLEEIGLFKR
jgi:hypothetical protein